MRMFVVGNSADADRQCRHSAARLLVRSRCNPLPGELPCPRGLLRSLLNLEMQSVTSGTRTDLSTRFAKPLRISRLSM